jgi:putative hydrolase of the HAD superfamily
VTGRSGVEAVPSPSGTTWHRGADTAANGRRLVVLDIDDTLYLERDYVRSGFAAVGVWARDELGVDGLGDRAWAAFEAGTRHTIFDEALAAAGVEATDDLVSRLVQVYRSHAPTIEMLTDARAWLDSLAPHVALAVVTDGPLASQQAKAEALLLSRWADLIVFTETLGPGRGKPHPAAFEQLEREVGLHGDRCAYVADNPAKDFVAPHRLGWRTVRVRRPESLHADVPSGADVDAEITGLDGLDTALAWGDDAFVQNSGRGNDTHDATNRGQKSGRNSGRGNDTHDATNRGQKSGRNSDGGRT